MIVSTKFSSDYFWSEWGSSRSGIKNWGIIVCFVLVFERANTPVTWGWFPQTFASAVPIFEGSLSRTSINQFVTFQELGSRFQTPLHKSSVKNKMVSYC